MAGEEFAAVLQRIRGKAVTCVGVSLLTGVTILIGNVKTLVNDMLIELAMASIGVGPWVLLQVLTGPYWRVQGHKVI